VSAGGRSLLDRLAAAARARQLVLTHLRSVDEAWLLVRNADAARAFDGPIHLATPNREFYVRASRL
jgi:ribonuclease BN (tRNA processing enzyme)